MKSPSQNAMDLMRYVDGELGESQRAELENHMQECADDRAIVRSFESLGQLVREASNGRAAVSGADSIADSVMAAISDSLQPPGKNRSPGLHARRLSRPAAIAFGGVACAVAALAAVGVYRMSGVQPLPEAGLGGPRPSVSALAASIRATDAPPSVLVDAVDFGKRTGTIFYIPTDSGYTTVVWLSDDEAGGSR